jgi:hypothetical protein
LDIKDQLAQPAGKDFACSAFVHLTFASIPLTPAESVAGTGAF